MKSLLSLLGFSFLSACLVRAQVTVELVLDDDYFLPGESLVTGVRITNLSGQTLKLGKEADWLTFSVESRNNFTVSALGDVPVVGEFEVESTAAATKRVDLAPYYQLTLPGHYTVAATVKIPQWQQELISKPKNFVITSGRTLWEQDFGVPNPTGSNAPPEVRRYALQSADHLKEKRLYVRVTDAVEGRIYRVFPVGLFVSSARPELQLDKLSNLHLLFQTGARSFNYSVINPDGQLILRQTYEYNATRPILKPDQEGDIIVAGGMRRVTANDLPPGIPVTSMEPLAPISPAPVATAIEYTTRKGDSFAGIAKANGITVKELQQANPGVDSRKLKVGQKIQVPAPAGGATNSMQANDVKVPKS